MTFPRQEQGGQRGDLVNNGCITEYIECRYYSIAAEQLSVRSRQLTASSAAQSRNSNRSEARRTSPPSTLISTLFDPSICRSTFVLESRRGDESFASRTLLQDDSPGASRPFSFRSVHGHWLQRACTVISELNVRITTVKVIWESRDGQGAARQNRRCERNCVLNLALCLPGLYLNFSRTVHRDLLEQHRTA